MKSKLINQCNFLKLGKPTNGFFIRQKNAPKTQNIPKKHIKSLKSIELEDKNEKQIDICIGSINQNVRNGKVIDQQVLKMTVKMLENIKAKLFVNGSQIKENKSALSVTQNQKERKQRQSLNKNNKEVFKQIHQNHPESPKKDIFLPQLKVPIKVQKKNSRREQENKNLKQQIESYQKKIEEIQFKNTEYKQIITENEKKICQLKQRQEIEFKKGDEKKFETEQNISKLKTENSFLIYEKEEMQKSIEEFQKKLTTAEKEKKVVNDCLKERQSQIINLWRAIPK